MFMDMKLRNLWKEDKFPSENLAQSRQVWNRIQMDSTGMNIITGLRADAGMSLLLMAKGQWLLTMQMISAVEMNWSN
jgi:hypothetical protein